MGMIKPDVVIKPNGDTNNSVVNIWSQIVQGVPVDPLEQKLKELNGGVIDAKTVEGDR